MGEADLPQGLEAVEAGHRHVEQNHVGKRAFAQPREQCVAALIGRGLVAARPQHASADTRQTADRRRRWRVWRCCSCLYQWNTESRPTPDGPAIVHVCTRCFSSTNAAQINFKPLPPFTKSTGRASGAPGPDCRAASESSAPASTINSSPAHGAHGARLHRALRRTPLSRRSRRLARGRDAFVVLDRAACSASAASTAGAFDVALSPAGSLTKSAADTRSGTPCEPLSDERAHLSHVHAERGQRAECLTRLFERLARVVDVRKSAIEI